MTLRLQNFSPDAAVWNGTQGPMELDRFSANLELREPNPSNSDSAQYQLHKLASKPKRYEPKRQQQQDRERLKSSRTNLVKNAFLLATAISICGSPSCMEVNSLFTFTSSCTCTSYNNCTPQSFNLTNQKQQATARCLTHEGLFFPPGMVALRQLSLILEFGFSMLFRVEVLAAIIQVFG